MEKNSTYAINSISANMLSLLIGLFPPRRHETHHPQMPQVSTIPLAENSRAWPTSYFVAVPTHPYPLRCQEYDVLLATRLHNARENRYTQGSSGSLQHY